jgi:transposase
MPNKHTSSDKIQLVIWNHEQGKSVKDICSQLNMPRRTVYRIIWRYKNEDRIDLKYSPGRPKILSEHDERGIMRKIKKNPRLSAPRLASELFEELHKKVSPQTIRKTIIEAGYNGRIARKKPFINERNRRKRVKFAKEYIKKPPTYWNDVVFADESKFNVFGSDGRVNVWRKPNEELKPENLRPTVKHGGGGLMVWGCVSSRGVGELVVIDGIMNAEKYLTLLKANLPKSVAKMGIQRSFKYYEDNDPKHTARIIQEWQLYKCPHVVHPPAQSPDLNIIENLWDELDRRVHATPVSSRVQLEARLREEWSKMDVEYIQKLVASMPNRLKLVLDNKGYPTRY